MREVITTISALSMTAALCENLMRKNVFSSAFRLVLGLEITRVILLLMCEMGKALLKRS